MHVLSRIGILFGLFAGLCDDPAIIGFSGRESVDLRSIESPEKVRVLNLHYSHIVPASWTSLKTFTCLEDLCLRNTSFADEQMEHLTTLKHLRRLDISVTGVTDTGMIHFEKMRNIKSLYLMCTRVTKNGMKSLRSLNNLQFLDLQDTKNIQGGVIHIAELPELADLSFVGCEFDDSDSAALAKMVSLRRLLLSETNISSEGCNRLVGLTNLEELELDKNRAGLDDRISLFLSRLKNLRVLDLSYNAITSRLCDSLEGLTKLESLDLTATRIDNDGMRSIGKLDSLQSLVLNSTPIDIRGVSHLKHLKNLKTLRLATLETTISKEDRATMREWLPKTNIIFGLGCHAASCAKIRDGASMPNKGGHPCPQ